MSSSLRRTWPGIAVLVIGWAAACTDPRCPGGYGQVGDTCYRIKDASVPEGSAATDEDSDEDAGNDAERGGNDSGGSEKDAGLLPSDLDGTLPEDAGAFLDDTSTPPVDAAPLDGAGESDSDAPDAPAATCTSQPCQNGGTCVDGATGFVCDCPEPFVGDRCELEICGPTTIQARAHLDAARACAEIRGNLQLFGGVTEITADDLPHLRVVTGDLYITNRRTPGTERITLNSLEVVEGKVEVSLAAVISVISFPELTTIGTPAISTELWIAQASTLGRLEMPKLSIVHGDVAFQFVPLLCSLIMPRVAAVSGDVALTGLPNAPYSSFAKLLSSTSSGGARSVGCCVLNDSFGCDDYLGGCSPITCP